MVAVLIGLQDFTTLRKMRKSKSLPRKDISSLINFQGQINSFWKC